MNGSRLSVNRTCAVGAAFLGLLSTAAVTAAFLFTRNPAIVWLGLLFTLLVFTCAALFMLFLRRKLVLFSDRLCETIDNMLDGACLSGRNGGHWDRSFLSISVAVTAIPFTITFSSIPITRQRRPSTILVSTRSA